MPRFAVLQRRLRAIPHPRVWAVAFCLLAGGITGTAAADSLGDASRLFKAGEYAQALAEINRHLASKPKDPHGRFLKGIILSGLNKQDEAIAIFRKLTEDHPEFPEPYNNLAVIYAQQKQYEKAKEALEKAIRTHPAYATAHENLGDIYARLASQAYGKALQFDAANASAQIKLAMIDNLVGGNPKPGTASPAKPPATTIVAQANIKPSAPPAPTPASPAVIQAPAPQAAAKPEPPKPAAAPSPAALAPTAPATAVARATEAEIIAAVDGWLAAWSDKNITAYLAHYAADFQIPGGKSRKSWENERRSRIDKPGKIKVRRDKLSIGIEGVDRATVRFRQHYRSASFKSSSGKTLILVKRDGRWLIQQERVGG